MVGLAKGATHHRQNERFEGNRSSTLMVLKSASPAAFGALASVIEHRIMFEGFLQGLNPFDQPGVELGKRILSMVLQSSSTDQSVVYEIAHFAKELMDGLK